MNFMNKEFICNGLIPGYILCKVHILVEYLDFRC